MGWVTLTLRKRVLKEQHAEYQMRDLQISREKRQLARRKQYETVEIQLRQKQALAPIKQSYNETMDQLEEKRKALNEYMRAAEEIVKSKEENRNYKVCSGNENESKVVIIENEEGKYVTPNGDSDGTYQIYDEEKDQNGFYDFNAETSTSTSDFYRCDVYNLSGLADVTGLPSLEDITEDDLSSLQSTIDSELSNIQLEKEEAQLNYIGETDNCKTIYEGELEILEENVNDEETMLDLEQSDVESQMEAISQEMQAVSEAVSTQIQNSTIKLA